jgi:succinyl-CoA synthetase beta subunit
MRLFEFQAKQVFSKAGIAVPKGLLARDAKGAVAAANEIGYPCVLKAQVLRGGRGKAGLIRLVRNENEARDASKAILAAIGGAPLLVEEAVDIAREIYLSITVDPVSACALVLACAEGGIEIEELARSAPEKIIRESVPFHEGLLPFRARNIAYSLGLEGEAAKQFAGVLEKLYGVFIAQDAELAEINPLFITKSGSLVAGDGKLSIDDNSMHRHPEWEPGRDSFDSDIGFEAWREGIPYLQFDGDISLMCAGAGLTTTVFDLIVDAGGSVANYLEFGGPNYRKGLRAMELCVRNNPKVILIVTFGTIARADVMADGIVEAVRTLKPECPIVVCIRGTGEDAAAATLRAAGLEPLVDTEQAVRTAVALSRGRRGQP